MPEKVKANGTDKAYIYLWIVPTMVAGDWRMEFDVGAGKTELVVLTFNQQYQMIKPHAADYELGPMKMEKPVLKATR